MGLLVYFSSKSENTHRFVTRTGLPARRIPMKADETPVRVDEPYVLVVPSYSDGEGNGAVPGPVIRFLNDANNRAHLRGVIAAGNRNFGAYFGHAGEVVAKKCGVPCLYRFEMMGTDEDVHNVKKGIERLWQETLH